MNTKQVISQSEYNHYDNSSAVGQYVSLRDARGTTMPILINELYELAPIIGDTINRDSMYNSDPSLKGSRIVELCKHELNEHSVPLLRFLLPPTGSITDITMITEQPCKNISYSVSLNELLKREVVTDITIEIATILINHTPDLIYRFDVSNHCALYTFAHYCTPDENSLALLKIMLKTVYDHLFYDKSHNVIAVNNFPIVYVDTVSKLVSDIKDIVLFVLLKTVSLMILRFIEHQRCPSRTVITMIKCTLNTIITIKKSTNYEFVVDTSYNLNLRGRYFDSSTSVLHLLLSSALSDDCTQEYKTVAMDIYKLLLQYGFKVTSKTDKITKVKTVCNDICNNYITTVVDDNDMTCAMYASQLEKLL